MQTIHEEQVKGGKTYGTVVVDKNIKATAGNTAFSYNQKAHKKYSS